MLVEGVVPTARQRLVTIAESAQLIEAARFLRDARTDIVVVCGSDLALTGVITKTDVVRQISHCQGSSCTSAASSVMTRDPVACRPTDWLHDVWLKMKDRRLKNVPITDLEARPLGVLNARDALEALLDEVENEESLLRDYVMCVGYH
jgi:signal-transduction protein with cAMP-binding, CBS, and nucleotidyltransferase domain